MTRTVRHAALVLMAMTLPSTAALHAQNREPSIQDEAKRQVGQVATLCGAVVAYKCERRDRTALLAIDKTFPRPGIAIAISAEARERFGPLFESRYVLHDVCATGRVEKRKNLYVVAVTDPEQLQLQGDSSPAFVTLAADAVSPCDEGVELPTLRNQIQPEYVQTARSMRIEGDVTFEAVVLSNGQVGPVRLLQSLDARYGLDDSAAKALAGWRFTPGTRHGRPVPVVVTIQLRFRL